MDGHFVPNLTIGPPVVEALKRATRLPLDVHLMIEKPEETLDRYLDAGADWISVHVEATRHLQRCLERIRRAREAAAEAGSRAVIEVDGGVDAGNAAELVEAGAEILVAGTAIYGQGDPKAAIGQLRAAARGGVRV